MPRFVARPYVVAAECFGGSIVLWPEEFRLAVVRHLGDGTIHIMTSDGARPCRYGDWVINGPAGFEVVHRAPFEAMFAEADAAPPADPKRPAPRKG